MKKFMNKIENLMVLGASMRTNVTAEEAKLISRCVSGTREN